MAIYHCNVKIISRSSGRTAVASAAYRSGDRLYSQYTGETSDYSRKGWIEYTNIFLPDNAPRQYYDRETLWNAVEASEKAPDAQVAREVEVALPAELSKEQQEQLAEAFVRDQFVSRGMIADVCIHRPPVTDDRHRPLDKDGRITKDPDKMIFINPHAHILLTMRPLDDHGKWQPKTKKEYKCIRDGVEKGFTADEFDQAKEHGWEKQYKYQFGPSTKWLPESEGESLQLQKVSRDPKTTHGGRHNPIVAEWNNPERVKEWRKAWEEAVNRSLEQAGLSERVDYRSFKDQGIRGLGVKPPRTKNARGCAVKQFAHLFNPWNECQSVLLYKVARVNEIDSHSSCLFAKSRSGTYPRFCLFALLAPGTYPRFLGSQGTYPPVFAH